MTTEDFIKVYWKYYCNLERDIMDTDKYVSIDCDNSCAFSVEYLKIFQSICAEVDIVAKVFCRELDAGFSGDKIQHYCKIITVHYSDFVGKSVNCIPLDKAIIPWDKWSCCECDNNGHKVVRSKDTPDWWEKHNKIKHSRTLFTNGRINYKYASQNNVILSMAALYQLELYFFKELAQTEGLEVNVPLPMSNLFSIYGWENITLLGEHTYAKQVGNTLCIGSL